MNHNNLWSPKIREGSRGCNCNRCSTVSACFNSCCRKRLAFGRTEYATHVATCTAPIPSSAWRSLHLSLSQKGGVLSVHRSEPMCVKWSFRGGDWRGHAQGMHGDTMPMLPMLLYHTDPWFTNPSCRGACGTTSWWTGGQSRGKLTGLAVPWQSMAEAQLMR